MKENGFAIGLLIATLVIGGALVFLGVSQKNRYAGVQSDFSNISTEVKNMADVRPFPTQENLDERKTEVIAFRGKVEGLQNAVQAYRPENLEKISPSDFQNSLVAKTEEIKKLFGDKVGYPEQFAFGMESYKDALPNPEATAKLNYQLEATEWMFQQLAKDGIYTIKNAVREALPSESGKNWTDAYEYEEDVPLAQSMPLEVTFLADEPAANEFINSLVTSKKYFFVVDMVRITNENPNPPVRSQSGLEEVEEEFAEEGDGGGFGAFGNFNFEEGEEEAEGEEAEGEDAPEPEAEDAPVVEEGLILGQVVGKEGLYVGLQIRLLLFGEPVELPEIEQLETN